MSWKTPAPSPLGRENTAGDAAREWPISVIDKSVIDGFLKDGVIPSSLDYKTGENGGSLSVPPDYTVASIDRCALNFPPSSFLLSILEFYGIQLIHLSP